MDFDNPAADMSGLGIPGNVIADFEAVCHLILFNGRRRKSVQDAAVAAASTRRLRRGSLILPRSGGFPREPRRSESAGELSRKHAGLLISLPRSNGSTWASMRSKSVSADPAQLAP